MRSALTRFYLPWEKQDEKLFQKKYDLVSGRDNFLREQGEHRKTEEKKIKMMGSNSKNSNAEMESCLDQVIFRKDPINTGINACTSCFAQQTGATRCERNYL